jgi:curved DNA-binding protein CbpA
MDNRRNYYRILQVQPDAPFEIIRTSYHTLLHKLKQHPDLGGEHWNATVLNEAFQTLSDEGKRSEYDKKLFQHYTKNFSFKKRVKKQSATTSHCHFCKKPLTFGGHFERGCICHSSPFQAEKQDRKRMRCRRALIRTEKLEKFHFITSTSEDEYVAQMVDLSPKGVRFLSKKALKPKEIIKIDCSLLSAIAVVINSQRVVKNGRVFYSIGAHFQSITFTHQEGTFLSSSI